MKKQSRKLADVRKALSSMQLTAPKSQAIRGGDDLEVFPWIDAPGG